MQHEITKKDTLLKVNGELREPGYAKSLILDYNRYAIKASKLRIKEWDYYFISNGSFGLALTIADNGYMGLDSISLFDFNQGWEHTTSPMRLMPLGKTRMPSSSEVGNAEIYEKKYYLSFKHAPGRRILTFHMDEFYENHSLDGEIVLDCPETESMVIATPFKDKPKHFYYNQKINCMPARGIVHFNDQKIVFGAEDSFGVLDWGRGVWTYKNTWFWGSASGLHEGVPFGFNIGCGFGDTSAATENMLFYNNKAHKLSKVKFNIPTAPGQEQTDDKIGGEDFMEPWTFSSDDGRFEMTFEPVLDRSSKTNFGILCSDQHQVFGRFTGKAILDSGTILNVKDFFGFAEKVHNKW